MNGSGIKADGEGGTAHDAPISLAGARLSTGGDAGALRPLYPRKRTSSGIIGMSAKCQ